jgi:hypothetical protein
MIQAAMQAHYFDSIDDCANMVGNAEYSARISITP